MKKESLKCILCLLAGIAGTVFVFACMFKNLHWPGGALMLSIITPALLSLLMIFLSTYAAKFGALKACDKPAAKHLLRVEVAAFITIALLFIALMFRACHWPGGAQLVLITCSTLAILSFLAGIFGCKMQCK